MSGFRKFCGSLSLAAQDLGRRKAVGACCVAAVSGYTVSSSSSQPSKTPCARVASNGKNASKSKKKTKKSQSSTTPETKNSDLQIPKNSVSETPSSKDPKVTLAPKEGSPVSETIKEKPDKQPDTSAESQPISVAEESSGEEHLKTSDTESHAEPRVSEPESEIDASSQSQAEEVSDVVEGETINTSDSDQKEQDNDDESASDNNGKPKESVASEETTTSSSWSSVSVPSELSQIATSSSLISSDSSTPQGKSIQKSSEETTRVNIKEKTIPNPKRDDWSTKTPTFWEILRELWKAFTSTDRLRAF